MSSHEPFHILKSQHVRRMKIQADRFPAANLRTDRPRQALRRNAEELTPGMLSKGTRKKALAVSIFWILALYFLTEPSSTFRWFLMVGVLPVVAFWLFVWARPADSKASASSGLLSRFRRNR